MRHRERAAFSGTFPRETDYARCLDDRGDGQTAAVLVLESGKLDPEGKLVYFMSISEARFRRPVVPGDVLRIEVKKIRNRGNVWKFEGKAKVEERTVAEATYSAMLVENV